jgi:DnaJ family protein C protein 7
MSQLNSDQPTPMDVDTPSSPAQQQQPNGTPSQQDQDARPAPPPHRYTTSPPPQTANYAATPEEASTPVQAPTIDAEEYKAAGNKFFKIKDYPQAIKEYTKGAHFSYHLASRVPPCTNARVSGK